MSNLGSKSAPSNKRPCPSHRTRRVSGLLLAATIGMASPSWAGAGNTNAASERSPVADVAEAKPGARLRDRLFAALKAARSETEGRAIENEIWRFWLADAPDATSRALVERAMKKRGVYDTEGAEALLDKAIARSPDYAEAYNQRAFVRFLRENMDGALEDADQALAFEPKHFGAMAGRALILMRQGRFRLAQDQLRQAVAIHPFLKERSMILPTEPGQGPHPASTPSKGIDL